MRNALKRLVASLLLVWGGVAVGQAPNAPANAGSAASFTSTASSGNGLKLKSGVGICFNNTTCTDVLKATSGAWSFKSSSGATTTAFSYDTTIDHTTTTLLLSINDLTVNKLSLDSTGLLTAAGNIVSSSGSIIATTNSLFARATEYGHVYFSQTAYGGTTGYDMRSNPTDSAGNTAFLLRGSISGGNVALTAADILQLGAGTSGTTVVAKVRYDGLGTFTGGLLIPTAKTLSLNAGSTSTIQDSSGDIRVDVATGKTVKTYVNNVLVSTQSGSDFTLAANMSMGNYDLNSKYIGPANSSQTMVVEGRNNAANTVALELGNNGTMTVATNRYAVGVGKGHDLNDLLLIDTYGKFHHPAAVVGTATLSSGTVTVSTAAVKTGDIIMLSPNTPGGTCGADYVAPVASISDATSFVINNVSVAGATVATCTSTVNWWIVTPNVTL